MCGITGFVGHHKKAIPADLIQKNLEGMVRSIRHRGPDDTGLWADSSVGLGHTRLAILDLSHSGHQPMLSNDGNIVVAFNGEIYNFQEIREILSAKGFAFHSSCDTEVLLNGYLAWGDDVIDVLRGMFAFAVWDRRKGRLLLARDRFGKKPLYYCWTSDGLVFGSEIKSILMWPGVRREIDLEAIDSYLSLQYVPAPRSAFQNISKLPAAHKLVVSWDENGKASSPQGVQRYWQLSPPAESMPKASVADLQAELRERLKEAVRLRMRSDVPLGAFLSGGVDSSAVVALMSEIATRPVKTFSIGFTASEYDETRYAQLVAERYATDHTTNIVDPDAISSIPDLVWHYNEPFADPSAIPTYYLSKLAKESVTVALSGDGGDEGFMGYGRYTTMRHVDRATRMPPWLNKSIAAALRYVPSRFDRRSRATRLAELLSQGAMKASQKYSPTITYFSDLEKERGYGDALMPLFKRGSALEILETYFDASPSLVSGANWADIHTYLPDDLMVKVDVASMAHSLETRAPFLDHELMTWAAALPEQINMADGTPKSLLKSALEDILPHEILYRPKMGFGCPVDHWLRHELKEMAYDTLLSTRFRQRGFFATHYVEKLLDEHCQNRVNHHTRLWALLMLEFWCQMWIDPHDGVDLSEPPAQTLWAA